MAWDETPVDHEAEAAKQAEVAAQVEDVPAEQPVVETVPEVTDEAAVYDANDVVEVSLPADAVGLDGQELVSVTIAGTELRPGDSVEVPRSVALAFVGDDERAELAEVAA